MEKGDRVMLLSSIGGQWLGHLSLHTASFHKYQRQTEFFDELTFLYVVWKSKIIALLPTALKTEAKQQSKDIFKISLFWILIEVRFLAMSFHVSF